jgi:hypothetical protein
MEKFLSNAANQQSRIAKILDKHGRAGRDALASATPLHTGLAANSWNYEVITSKDDVRITWTNSNVENGFVVVIALQYGYATGTGGYVAGRDFINPAIKPIFDRISHEVWKEVTSG